MKKLFLICFIAMLLCACTEKKYEVTYIVYYPNHAKTYTKVVDGVPSVECYRGVNYIKCGTRSYFSSIAPLEILDYKEIIRK